MNGKICYLEMPSKDPATSANFYARAFGWNLRTRGDGATAFDDTTGQVSGAFVDRPAWTDPGLLFYIMVDDIHAAIRAVVANGGVITMPFDPDFPEIIALFRDPGGNTIGLYQEKVKSTG